MLALLAIFDVHIMFFRQCCRTLTAAEGSTFCRRLALSWGIEIPFLIRTVFEFRSTPSLTWTVLTSLMPPSSRRVAIGITQFVTTPSSRIAAEGAILSSSKPSWLLNLLRAFRADVIIKKIHRSVQGIFGPRELCQCWTYFKKMKRFAILQ